MEGTLTLAEMRAATRLTASWGPGHRTLGLLFCQECGSRQAFITHDAHVAHITDAECERCGHVYGRRDVPSVTRGVVGPDGAVRSVTTKPQRGVPVIDDATAAAAAAAWRDLVASPTRDPLAETPPPVPKMPGENDAPDGSRVASFLRSQR